MRRFALFFLSIRLPLDYLAIVVAGLAAYSIRFGTLAEWRNAQELIPFERYLFLVFVLSGLWIAAFAAAGLYRSRRLRAVDEYARVFMASSAAIMAVVALIFLQRELFASRFIVLAAWLLSIVFVSIERLIVRVVELVLLSQGFGRRSVAVIGDGASLEALVKAAAEEPGLAMKVVAKFSRFDDRAENELRKIRKNKGLDELIVLNPKVPDLEAKRLLRFVDETQVTLRYGADLFSARRISLEFVSIGGVPLLEIKHTPLDGWGRIFKRSFDIVAGVILLVMFSPIIAFVAIAVWLESGSPIFFRQERVGERGEIFSFIKFRSMRVGAEKEWAKLKRQSARTGPVPKIKDDPRVTRFGRFIRRWSLDELPQLINVIVGDMSLVGPRPHLPEEVARYESEEKKLLEVKPGITGLAQISGRADIAFADEARLDLWYIEHWSPLIDIAILARTPVVVLGRKGAY